ncbi:hypothetical protein DVA76_18260, partial [Acinetobacter baumannii]
IDFLFFFHEMSMCYFPINDVINLRTFWGLWTSRKDWIFCHLHWWAPDEIYLTTLVGWWHVFIALQTTKRLTSGVGNIIYDAVILLRAHCNV